MREARSRLHRAAPVLWACPLTRDPQGRAGRTWLHFGSRQHARWPPGALAMRSVAVDPRPASQHRAAHAPLCDITDRPRDPSDRSDRHFWPGARACRDGHLPLPERHAPNEDARAYPEIMRFAARPPRRRGSIVARSPSPSQPPGPAARALLPVRSMSPRHRKCPPATRQRGSAKEGRRANSTRRPHRSKVVLDQIDRLLYLGMQLWADHREEEARACARLAHALDPMLPKAWSRLRMMGCDVPAYGSPEDVPFLRTG